MQIEIREYKECDKNPLSYLFYQVRYEEFPWTDRRTITIADFEHFVEGEKILIALVDNQTAGFISVWEPDKFIHHLYISKQYRMIGVGKALIDKAKSIFGIPLTLKCVKENNKAVDFYHTNGWKTIKEEAGSEGPYYLMSLDQ